MAILEPMDVGRFIFVENVNGNRVPPSSADQLVSQGDDEAREVFAEHGRTPVFALIVDGMVSVPVTQVGPLGNQIQIGTAQADTRVPLMIKIPEVARLIAVIERFRSVLNPFWTEQLQALVEVVHHELADVPIDAMDMEDEASKLTPEMFTQEGTGNA